MAFSADEERQLKEVLYLLMEKVRATKAAFYAVEPSGVFALAAAYGFGRTDKVPDKLSRSDELVIAVNAHRDLYYVNDPKQAGPLADHMAGASSTRLLFAPLYVDARLTGIVDVRDKAGREPFLPEDAGWVKEVVKRLGERLRQMGRVASGSTAAPEEEMTIERLGTGGPADVPASAAPAAAPAPAVAVAPSAAAAYLPGGTARTLRFVEETLARAPSRAVSVAGDPGALRAALDTSAYLPGVEAAAVTTIGRNGARALLSARRALAPEVGVALLENVEKVFARAGAAFPMPHERSVTRTGPEPAGAPVGRADVTAIQSSVLSAARDEVLVLSFLYRPSSTPEEREELKAVHGVFKSALADLRGAAVYRDSYKALVNKLLEPGLKKYAALKTHSFNVGRMARKFAGFLSLSPEEIEQVTVAAILHDVGMRDLNYDELYSKRDLDEEEKRLLREHARVGAFLLEEIPWPYSVAPLVRHHHERWDGAGYPDGRRGEEIPFGARLIHVCEAFDAMTSPASYRPVVSVPQALEIIEGKGGTQFDPELAGVFRKLVDTLKPGR